MAEGHTGDSRGTTRTTTRRSVLQLGGLSVGALLGGGVAASVAQTDPVCEPGSGHADAIAFGANGYGAIGYGGAA